MKSTSIRSSLLGATLFAILLPQMADAQLAGSGTAGDRVVYSIGPGAVLASGLGTSVVHDFDTDLLPDTADSFELGADGGADDTKVFLTAGHHVLLYATEYDSIEDRAALDTFVRLNGTAIPYGAAAGYARDATNDDLFVTGGTILSVAQGDAIEIESVRTDNEPRDITQQGAELQLIKLDDANLAFLRLGLSADSLLFAASEEGPTAVPFDVADELAATAFAHDSGTAPDEIVLKSAGHYLVFANTGLRVHSGSNHRNSLTQQLLLNGSPAPGGATTVYLRHSAATDGIGGLVDEGAASIGVLVEVTEPNSTLEVLISRDNDNSDSMVDLIAARTGLAIAKLPSYGDYIVLSGDPQLVNLTPAIEADLSVSPDSSNATFAYSAATSTSEVEINQATDCLFLSSHYGQAASGDNDGRSIVKHSFQTTPLGGSPAPLGYGIGGAYNRDKHSGADRARFSGGWAAAIIPVDVAGATVEATTEGVGGVGANHDVTTSSLGLQALNIASISAAPPIPVIVANNPLGVTVNDPEFAITSTDLLTIDGNNPAVQLTYTLDSQPAGGTLKLSGATLDNGDTFTQDDIDNDRLTFAPGATPAMPGGFDFTVRDPDLNAAGGSFTITVVAAISLTADAGFSDENSAADETSLGGGTLLSNDTGDALAITAFDSTSTLGAAVQVNADGTFTYDPTNAIPAQAGGAGDTPVDTFTYTVTDSVGKTAQATVTMFLTGIEDGIGALDDAIAGATEDTPLVSTADLTANDGIVRTDPAGTTETLLLNWDARYTAGTGRWENLGPGAGPDGIADLDWILGSGVTHNPAVTSSRARITAAYEFDGSIDAAGTFLSPDNGLSIHDIVVGDPDTADASFEIWAKLGAGDLAQMSTLFETGGGTGIGIIIDNGVLEAATELDGASSSGSYVSYDLVADPLGLVGGDPTAEFNQYLVTLTLGGGLELYVNGVRVAATTSGGPAADWDGGDGSGLGRFGENNHGGFVNAAVDTDHNTNYFGAIAAFRIYSGVLSVEEVMQNFAAVATGADLDTDAFVIDGIFDSGATLRGVGVPATLASGATVTLDTAGGHFTYDPNAAFDFLGVGEAVIDSFTYQLSAGPSPAAPTAVATVTVTVTGTINSANPDTLAVREELVTRFGAGALVGNDQHPGITPGAYLSVSPASISGNTWLNEGSAGASHDVTMAGGAVVTAPALQSNFGGIGAAWRRPSGTAPDFEAPVDITEDDFTLEVWFRPKPLQGGTQTIFEAGGANSGASIVYNPGTNQVIVTADANTGGPDTVQVALDGVDTGGFNQVLAVLDMDASGTEDTLSVWLNTDPTTAFDATPDGTDTNVAGTTNEWGGTDDTGIGTQNGDTALDGDHDGFAGDIAIVRLYPRALSTAELQANYDSIAQPIITIGGMGPGNSITTTLGATVTFNADGSFDYDGSTITGDILPGNTAVDSFTYGIADGMGGTSIATASVNVTGVDESFLAFDDRLTIGEDDGPAAIPVLDNDTHAGATVELYTVVAGFLTDYTSGSAQDDPADFTGTTGWRYLWNAPTDWDGTASLDGTTGPLGVAADYQLLKWDDIGLRWTADGDDVNDNGPPSNHLRIAELSCHPGRGFTQAEGIGNNLARAPIFAYTVDTTGHYAIVNSFLTRIETTNRTIRAQVYVEDMLLYVVPCGGGNTVSFNGELGPVNAGETIYVAISPDDVNSNDQFDIDFDVARLPDAGSMVSCIDQNVTTNGTTVTFDPGFDDYQALGQGDSIDETFTYSITDGGSGLSTATVTVTIEGANDAPAGYDDNFATVVDDLLSGTLLDNDVDIDFGDTAGLMVAAVQGDTANVGVAALTDQGATVTVQADGSFVYDAATALAALGLGEFATDTFSYLVEDPLGLDADIFRSPDGTAEATVTITITGTNSGVIATDDSFAIVPSGTVAGNLISDDNGNGVDSSTDTSDSLAVASIDTTGTQGIVSIATPGVIGAHGTVALSVSYTLAYDNETGDFTVGETITGGTSNAQAEIVAVTDNGTDGILEIKSIAGIFIDNELITDGATGSAVTNGTLLRLGGQTVDYGTTALTNPVVVANPLSRNGSDSLVLHIDNVNAAAGTFDIWITEVPNLDSAHPEETVAWTVIEAGRHQLPDGSAIEAGTVSTAAIQQDGGPTSWETVGLASAFTNTPVILNSINSDNGAGPENGELYGTRMQNVTTTSFQVALEDHEGDGLPRSTAETIAWIAIEPGSGGWSGGLYEAGATPSVVTQAWYTLNFGRLFPTVPEFLAEIPTINGADPTNLRYQNLAAGSVQVLCAEDTFNDTELTHAAEAVNYLAIEAGGLLEGWPQGTVAGAFTYDPNGAFDDLGEGETATDSFTYTITDSLGETDTATVTITIGSGTGSALQEWRVANGFPSNGTGDGADDANPDFDALANLLEFAFGTDPNTADSRPLAYDGMAVTRGGPSVPLGTKVLRFLRRKDHGAPGSVAYQVRFSSDLASDWEPGTATPAVIADDGDYELVEMTFPVLGNGKTARFAQVIVTAIEPISALADWRVANGFPAGGTGAGANNANPDFDSLANLLEFAFGTDPNVADSRPLAYDGMGVTRGGPTAPLGAKTLRFLRRKDHGTPGSVAYEVRFTSDLASDWETATATPTVIADDGDYELVELPFPVLTGSGQQATLARIAVTES